MVDHLAILLALIFIIAMVLGGFLLSAETDIPSSYPEDDAPGADRPTEEP